MYLRAVYSAHSTIKCNLSICKKCSYSHVEEVEANAVEAFAHDVGGQRGGLAAGGVLAVVARQAEDHGLQRLLGRGLRGGARLRGRAAAAQQL